MKRLERRKIDNIYLDREEIYEILCDCGLMTIYTKDYGSLEMTDEDSIMDEFVPQLLDYINMKSEDSKFFME